MPINHEKKIIFIHIPKNAGESVEKVLRMYKGNPEEAYWGIIDRQIVLQHLTATQLKARLSDSKIWDKYFKFAIVRNPWTKAISEFNWYKRFGPSCDFKTWVRSLEHRIKINNTIHIGEIGHNMPQRDFIFDTNGNCMVDKILRFENIGEEFKKLASEQAWGVKLIHAKSTASKKKQDFKSYYDEESARIIESVYKMDIEAFGYSREETFQD